LKKVLILFSLCLIPLFLNSAYAVNSLENINLKGQSSIISLEIEFGQDTVQHFLTRSIVIHNLDEIVLTFYGNEISLAEPELRMMHDGNLFRISSVSDGIIMYGHKNMVKGNYDINVYIASNKGLEKFPVIASIHIPQVEKKIITTIEEPKEETQYIPDLMMTSSHDFRTYWKEMFDVDVQSFDGNINSNPTKYPFEGRLAGADVKVIISLDDEHFATLSGVTSERGNWAGKYFIEENITPPGEYTVDLILTYLGQSVTKTSSMFVIASTADRGSNVINYPTADAGPDQFVLTTDTPITLDGSGSSGFSNGPITYLWVQTSGTPVVLDDDTDVSPEFVNPGFATTIVFQLTVTGDDGISSSDSVTITITVP